MTPMLFIWTIRLSSFSMDEKEAETTVHLEMRNLKQTELQSVKDRGKKG